MESQPQNPEFRNNLEDFQRKVSLKILNWAGYNSFCY